jgi:hypothetical protein
MRLCGIASEVSFHWRPEREHEDQALRVVWGLRSGVIGMSGLSSPLSLASIVVGLVRRGRFEIYESKPLRPCPRYREDEARLGMTVKPRAASTQATAVVNHLFLKLLSVPGIGGPSGEPDLRARAGAGECHWV